MVDTLIAIETYYELWDADSGNRVGIYDTLPEALKDVRDALNTYGPEAREIVPLSLLKIDKDKHFVVAQGKGLADIAMVGLSDIWVVLAHVDTRILVGAYTTKEKALADGFQIPSKTQFTGIGNVVQTTLDVARWPVIE